MSYVKEKKRAIFLHVFLPVLIGIFPVGAWGGYTPVVTNGPELNRVNILFLGDGYTASQLDSVFTQHIDAMLKHLFDDGEDPYPRYRKFFNIYRIDLVSNESGADVPTQGIVRDTALDASFYYDGLSPNSLYVDTVKVIKTLAEELHDATFTPAVVLITVNSDRSGGGAGIYAVYAGGYALGPETALHEMGHVFNNLSDEYGGIHDAYRGPDPSEVNVTASPTGEKWKQWIGYDQPGLGVIGAYEGAYYYDYGAYRPSLKSKMRYLGEPFDAVAREKIILDIYNLVRPLDGWTDNATVLLDPTAIQVKSVDPDVIKIDWSINGERVDWAQGESFSPGDVGLDPGDYTVTARAYDPTDWVRKNQELLEQSVTWSVRFTTQTIAKAVHVKNPEPADNATLADNTTLPKDLMISYAVIPPAKALEELDAVAATANGKGTGWVFNPATWCVLPAAAPLGILLFGMGLLTGSGLKNE